MPTDSLLKLASGGPHTPAPFQQSELSPKQAAEACIVTAEKLETAGHRREAISLYEKAREHDAKAIDYSRRLAVLYDQQGDVANAVREYRKAITDDPKNPDLLNDFGYFHLTQGDLTAAETHFRTAISLDEDHQRAWANLGIVLAYQGQYQESLAAFTRVVGPAAAHSNVGAILAKHGKNEQAKRAFRQALALNAGLEQPRALLAHLEQSRPQDGEPAKQPQ